MRYETIVCQVKEGIDISKLSDTTLPIRSIQAIPQDSSPAVMSNQQKPTVWASPSPSLQVGRGLMSYIGQKPNTGANSGLKYTAETIAEDPDEF